MNDPDFNTKNRFPLIIIVLYLVLTVLFAILNQQSFFMITDEPSSMQSFLVYVFSGLPFLLLALYMVKLENQKISSYLSDAAKLLNKIANGNFNLRQNIDREDGLGKLLDTILSTSKKLGNLITPIESGIKSLEKPFQQLTSTGQQCKQNAILQSQLSSELTTIIEKLGTSTAKPMKPNTDGSAENMSLADDITIAFAEVSQSMGTIASVGTEIDDVANVITELQTSSEAIGSIIETINQIANQTNMLALNASIEAARAGEQGRGFAVVADEVRTLSQRTHEATTQIQGTIKKIQLDTDLAVEAINKTKESISSESLESSSALEKLRVFIDNTNSNPTTDSQISNENPQLELEMAQQIALKLSDTASDVGILTNNLINQLNAMQFPINELVELTHIDKH